MNVCFALSYRPSSLHDVDPPKPKFVYIMVMEIRNSSFVAIPPPIIRSLPKALSCVYRSQRVSVARYSHIIVFTVTASDQSIE